MSPYANKPNIQGWVTLEFYKLIPPTSEEFTVFEDTKFPSTDCEIRFNSGSLPFRSKRAIIVLRSSIMSCFSFLYGRNLDSSTQDLDDIGKEIFGSLNVNVYTYKALRTATCDFSPVNKIGEGGFGVVYKGKLKNGKMAAIKVLAPESRQGAREFLTEVKAISETEHDNLVKLYGCCVEGKQRILVYNYLENNSLAQTLLGGRSTIQFTWRVRANLCLGIAKGLAYLHEEVRPHIIHRDIKAGNILLDKDLTPKISDFGLAKFFPPNMTHVSTRVAGTIGYLAPEYAIRGQLTRKSDIYSFGVLVIEIVSGRNNTNTRLPPEEQFIVERTWQLYERRELVLLVDSSLEGHYDVEQACRFLKIGLLCTQDSLKLRPSMSTVVKMLSGVIDVDDNLITKPSLISDFMDLKVRTVQKPPSFDEVTRSGSSGSSESENVNNTTLKLEASSVATLSVTSIPYRRI